MTFLSRRILTAQRSAGISRWAASALLLTACSCSAVQHSVARRAADPFLEDESPAAPAKAEVRYTKAANPAVRSDVPDSGIVHAAHQVESGVERRPGAGSAGIRTGVERRLPDCEFCPVREGCPPVDESAAGCATRYPDDYLFDGGGRGSALSMDNDQRLALQPEDTAAAYRDECLKPRLTRSNCVAVYSPRFAAVTTISQLIEDVGGGRPTQAVGARSGVGLVNRVGTFAQHQRDATERLQTRV